MSLLLASCQPEGRLLATTAYGREAGKCSLFFREAVCPLGVLLPRNDRERTVVTNQSGPHLEFPDAGCGCVELVPGKGLLGPAIKGL